eukprot:5326975-Prymnesium_polylepis.1
MSDVRQLPPNESCNSLVSVDSRNGACGAFLPPCMANGSWLCIASLSTTVPSASKLDLIWRASLGVWPMTFGRLMRSEPARSTTVSLARSVANDGALSSRLWRLAVE